MARTTDVLQIKLEIQGDGTVKAALAEVGKEAERVGKGTSAAAGGVRMLGDAIAAFGVAKMVQGLITINREAEQLRVQLRTLEGSQAAATERFAQLQEMARSTPLSVNQVTEAYVKLKNFGLDPLDGTMQAIIDTGAALGGGFETINGLIMAFGQASAKGKLQGEEMLQMAERGVPVYDTLARALGKTTGEIQEMASKGQLGRDSIKLLADELGKANFGASAAQAATMDGAISALQDNIEQLAIALGDSGLAAVFTGLLRDVAEGVSVLTEWINQTGDASTEASALASILKLLGRAVEVVSTAAKLGGVQVGVLVDILGALASVAVAAGKAVVGQFHAMALAMSGDFKGAAAVIGATFGAIPDAVKSATDRMNNALKTGVDQGAEIITDLAKSWEEIDKASNDAAKGVEKAAQNAAGGTTQLTEAQKKAQQEATRLIASLQKQIAEHGKSETQLLREEAARLKATAATRAHGEALDQIIGTYERLQRQDAAVDGMMDSYMAVLDDAAEASRAFDELLTQQARDMDGPYVDAALKYAAAMEVIAGKERELLLLGKSAEEATKATAGARTAAINQYTKELTAAERTVRDAAMRQVEGFERVWLQGAANLAPALTDAILSGEWEDVGKRLAESIAAGLIDTLMEETITKPLQNALMSAMGGSDGAGGFSFGNFFDTLGQGWGGGDGSASGGAGGWNMGRIGGTLAGGMMAYQAHQSGNWLQGAAGGAMAGSSFGPWGMAIGAIVGTLGGVLGGDKDPYLTVGGVGRTRKPRTTFSTDFGQQQIGVRGGMPMEDFISQIQQFDQAMAGLIRSVGGGTEEIAAITRALAGWSADLKGGAATMENLLNQRLDVIIGAAEPAWAGFLSQIAGVEERIDAFTSLYAIRDQIDDLDAAAASLGGGPLVQLRNELDSLTKTVDSSMAALATAIEGQNPKEIEQAALAAQQAVIDRYNAEIQMVRELETALLTAQQQARALDLTLAQRIAGLSGDYSDAADTARVGMITTRALVEGTTDPERALAFLDEFIGNVDAWLQSSIAQVNALAQAEQNRINTALAGISQQQAALREAMAALESERNAIIAGATQRAQEEAAAANAAAQAMAQQQQAAQQAAIGALQEQLALAQEFQRVLDQARSMIEQMTFSASNPLGAQARLALLDQEIAAAEAAMAGSTGSEQAAAAARLLDLLNQRLGMVQSEGLMQRPDEDYLALYNDTLQRIAGVAGVAGPQASREEQLAEELNRIQSMTFDAVGGIAASVTYTAAEQERLNQIAEEEARIQAEIARLDEEALALQEEAVKIQQAAEEQIRQLNAEAVKHYEWARGEGARLQAERAAALQQQIDTITGGRPIDEFIAERQAETVGLLTSIRDDLRAFLGAISGDATSPGTGPGTGSGPGPGNGGGRPPVEGESTIPMGGITVAPVIQVSVSSGDPQQIAAAVRDVMQREMPQIATRVKRELSTA